MMYQIVSAVALIVVYFMSRIFKEPHPFIKSAVSIFCSTSTLLFLNIFSEKIGILMPLNLASVLTAEILGIPGICLMVILNVII